ncbi:MAG TPA: hypothetical protein VIV60_36520 [Polyangiaceae bacterium]
MTLELDARAILLGSVAAILLVVGLTLAWQRRYAVWRRQKRWLRANAAEAHALVWLQRLGYDILGAQVEGRYSIVLDGVLTPILLRADYIVTRAGLTYVAEVKSGKQAPRLSTAATRRQLLEYLIAFGVDGVLLVDGETQRVHEVVFPIALRSPGEQSRERIAADWAGAVAIAVAVAVAVAIMLGWYIVR